METLTKEAFKYAHIDDTYRNLLEDIIDNGDDRGDRTGTGTRSVFARHIKHNMQDGFPLFTTKKMYTKGIISELLWFLRGETNQTRIVKEGTNIWIGDGLKKWLSLSDDTIDIYGTADFSEIAEVRLNPSRQKRSYDHYMRRYNTKELYEKIYMLPPNFSPELKPIMTKVFKWLLLNNEEFAAEWGELGPIYGKQWRDWNGVDQIRNVVETLKSNPYSRRIMVNAWNVSEIDKMTLPPCHWGFQFWTRKLSNVEIYDYYFNTIVIDDLNQYDHSVHMGLDELNDIYINDLVKKHNLPTQGISMLWNQRSVDTFLGLGFNIASYGVLLEIIAKMCNMLPLELNGMLGDVHLYSNHFDAVQEQLENHEDGLFDMCTLEINDTDIDWSADLDAIIYSLRIDDFKFVNYKSHGTIKAPLSN
jgi:thymidylate synthase